MGSELSIGGESLDKQIIVRKRISNIGEIESIIRNDLMDRRSENDKVIDLQDAKLGHKIATIERGDKKYQILLDEKNKIILSDRTDIQTKMIGDDQRFFAASYQIYSRGEKTRGRYIKDIETDKVITQTLEAARIDDIKHHKEYNLYLIEMPDDSTIHGYTHVRLFNEKGCKIDEGGIKMLEDDLYVKKIWRWYDHERVADVFYNRIEKDDNDNRIIKTLFQGLETPSDYERHQDNHFRYAGDGIVIQSAPRGGKDVPSHSYDGEFSQATDIFNPEKKQSPEYTGRLFSISREIFGVRPQVFPMGNNIYGSGNEKFRAPYINFVKFDGEIITQKPYCCIEKVGNMLFAKQIKENMINISDRMNKTINETAIQETEIDKQYIKDETIKRHEERVIIDPETLDPIKDNELFIDIKVMKGFLKCVEEYGEIVIFDKNGNRKADSIKSYKTLQDKIYECTSILGERIYFDDQWNKIDF